MKKFLFIFLAIFALSAISDQVRADDELKKELINQMKSGGKKEPAKTTKATKTKKARKPTKAPAVSSALPDGLVERLEKLEEHFKEMNLTSENFDEFFAPRTVPFILITILLIVLWSKRGSTVRKTMIATGKLVKARKDENLKTKYDTLKGDYDALKRQYDALEQRLQNLENS